MQYLIEFLIPAYKRFDGVVAAALSIAEQVLTNRYEDIVRITVVDDASPGFDREKLIDSLGDLAGLVRIDANEFNKGMSQNIFDMVDSSQAEFCTILTDDDWLFEGKLLEIVDYLRSIESNKEIGGLFTPRYSYLETGELHCVVCRPCKKDYLIKAGPIQAVKYCSNGFILTGFIFRPGYFAKQEWSENIENGYFPVINFGFMLSQYSLLFVDRNWFHHTVLNQCHWESWGTDQLSQEKRLHRDYLDAITFIAKNFSRKATLRVRIGLYWYEWLNYSIHLSSVNLRFLDNINHVSIYTRKREVFFFTILVHPLFLFIRLIRRPVSSVFKIVKKRFLQEVNLSSR